MAGRVERPPSGFASLMQLLLAQCDLRQVSNPLWASVLSSLKWVPFCLLLNVFSSAHVVIFAYAHAVIIAVWAFPQLQLWGLSLQWLLLLQSTGSRGLGLQQSRLVGSTAQAQWLQRTGQVAPQPVGSSRTRDQTLVSCTGGWILHH